jgi:hypothetical protein
MKQNEEIKVWTVVCATVLSCVMLLCLKDIYIATLEKNPETCSQVVKTLPVETTLNN